MEPIQKSKIEILSECIVNDRSESIEVNCMIHGTTHLTIGEFLSTGIVNQQTFDIAPSIHKDFLYIPLIETLFKMLNSNNLS